MDLHSGIPYWLAKNGLMCTYRALHENVVCDVVVMGGGVTGALVAFHLVEAGFDVVVLDKRDIGWGSTAATTALLQYEIDTPLRELVEHVGNDHAVRSYQACVAAIGKLEHIAAALDEPCGFERKRSLYLANNRRAVSGLKAEGTLRNENGIRVEYLDSKSLRSRFDCRRPAALLSQDAAQVDAYRFTHLLLRKAARARCRVFDRTRVTGITHQRGGGVTLETDRRHTVSARKLVFAAGYETQSYLKDNVADLISTYALVSEPIEVSHPALDSCLIWESGRPYLYIRTERTENDLVRVIVGGEDEDFRDPARRDRLIQRKTKKLITKFHKLLPQVPLEPAFAWAGTFGETKDGLAYIGEHKDHPDAYFALGYGGNGITYSVLAAEIIRDALLLKPNEYADLFRFDR